VGGGFTKSPIIKNAIVEGAECRAGGGNRFFAPLVRGFQGIQAIPGDKGLRGDTVVWLPKLGISLGFCNEPTG